MKKSLFLVLTAAMILPLLSAHPANAGDCFQDPVYTRTWNGHAKQAAFVRDKECMEGSAVIKTLQNQEKVNIIAETDGWYKIKAADGTVGWVGQWLIQVDSQSGYTDLGPTPTKTTTTTTSTTDPALVDRVKGYVLLRVEKYGEAYYVHPVMKKRYYMKDGPTAYEMMRAFGLGITDADLERVKRGEWEITNRLKGRILLQVQQKGEAYYIHPKTGEAIYMKDGAAAYEIMRFHSLGISDNDLSKVPEETFQPI